METKFNQDYFAKWRKASGLTQQEILKAINCTAYETIRNWDNGNLIPTNRIIELCMIYNIPVTNFFLTDGGQTYTDFFQSRLNDHGKTVTNHILRWFERQLLGGTEVNLCLQQAWEQFGDATERKNHTPSAEALPVGEGHHPNVERAEQINPTYEVEILKLRLKHAEEMAQVERRHHEELEQYRQLIRKEEEQTNLRNQEERMRLHETIEVMAQENAKLAHIVSQHHRVFEHKTSTGTSTYMVMEEETDGLKKH